MIHHGSNSDCPQVQSGEWTHCHGHEPADLIALPDGKSLRQAMAEHKNAKRVPALVFHTDDQQLANAVVASINAEYPSRILDPSVRSLPGHQPKYSVGVMVLEGHDDVTRNLIYFCRGVERGWHETFVAIRSAAERLEKEKR